LNNQENLTADFRQMNADQKDVRDEISGALTLMNSSPRDYKNGQNQLPIRVHLRKSAIRSFAFPKHALHFLLN
jgi:hypothetical protein